MFSIKVNGISLDLANDLSITMNLKSPAFNEGGSYSFPFKLPLSERNKSALNFIHRIESTSSQWQVFPCEILWNGIAMFSGTLKCNNSNNQFIDSVIYEGKGSFNYSLKNKTLQNVPFGGLTFGSIEESLDWANATIYPEQGYPVNPVAFPQIYDDAYFDPKPANLNLLYINNQTSHLHSIDYGDYMPIIPFLYFRFVLDKIFSYLDLELKDSFFSSSPEFNKMVLFNSVNANDDPYSNFFGTSLDNFKWDYHVPRIGLGDFIKGYENMFGVRHFINGAGRKIKLISLDDMVKSATYEDFSRNILSIDGEFADPNVGYKLSLSKDPGDPCFDAITQIEDEWLERVKEPVQSVIDLPPWPATSLYDMRFVLDRGKFYIYLSGWVESEFDYFNLPTRYIYINSENTIESKFCTLSETEDTEPYAICKNKRADWKSVTPRVFFTDYREIVHPYTLVGTNHLNDKSLFYNGENGLFTKQWLTFLGWKRTAKSVKVIKVMDFVELMEFDFSTKYMIHGTKYLFKELQVTFSMDKIQKSTLKGFTCY